QATGCGRFPHHWPSRTRSAHRRLKRIFLWMLDLLSTGDLQTLAAEQGLHVESKHDCFQTRFAVHRTAPDRSHCGLADRARPRSGRSPPSGVGEVPVLTAPNAYGPGIWHHAKAGKTWYGSYRTFPDTSAYCIDAGKKSPLSKYFRGATSEPATSAQTA